MLLKQEKSEMDDFEEKKKILVVKQKIFIIPRNVRI